MKRFFICLFLLVVNISTSYAQDKVHLIYFKDKENSLYSLDNPSEFLTEKALKRRQKQNISIQFRDLPVNLDYIQQVQATGAKVLYPTRWFNGVLIETDEVTFSEVQKLECVQQTATLSKALKIQTEFEEFHLSPNSSPSTNNRRLESEDYGASLTQIQLLGINKMHEQNFRGEGMTIAVMDNGFLDVDINPMFEHLTVLGTYDFVSQNNSVYKSGSHGTQVLSVMGAYKPSELIGGAYNASFYLFVTEDNDSESRAEEAFWLIAAERADSLGVDIISTSLGYNQFYNFELDYNTSDTDGNTSLITKAADIAVSTGMVVVTSAGNEGQSTWGTITFPADGDSVLAVGSVNSAGDYYIGSSRGYSADGRVKPDVVAMGVSTVTSNSGGFPRRKTGTSFAAPSVTALVAGVWQSQPDLTAVEVIERIRRSGSQFYNPDDKMGYGIPNFERTQTTTALETESYKQKIKIYPNPVENILSVLFNQSNFNEAVLVKIYTNLGKLVYQNTILLQNQFFQIPLSKTQFPSGMYLLVLESDSSVQTIQFIKH